MIMPLQNFESVSVNYSRGTDIFAKHFNNPSNAVSWEAQLLALLSLLVSISPDDALRGSVKACVGSSGVRYARIGALRGEHRTQNTGRREEITRHRLELRGLPKKVGLVDIHKVPLQFIRSPSIAIYTCVTQRFGQEVKLLNLRCSYSTEPLSPCG